MNELSMIRILGADEDSGFNSEHSGLCRHFGIGTAEPDITCNAPGQASRLSVWCAVNAEAPKHRRVVPRNRGKLAQRQARRLSYGLLSWPDDKVDQFARTHFEIARQAHGNGQAYVNEDAGALDGQRVGNGFELGANLKDL